MSRRNRFRPNEIDILTDAEKKTYDSQSSLRFKVQVVTTVGSLFGLGLGFLLQKQLCVAALPPATTTTTTTTPPGQGSTPPGGSAPAPLTGWGAIPGTAVVPTPLPPKTADPAITTQNWQCTTPLVPILGMLLGGALAYKLA